LHLSVITIKNAYEILEKEGLIESVPGKGFYIAAKNKKLIHDKKMNIIEETLAEIIEECKMMGISKKELSEIIDILYD
jgi:GntR family transcriptional regulator